ncbi:MAG: poly(3-hydroxybutyrate) depolymerase [Chitinophagaceae bacterium]|nr:MAG: poly(3-hydroxybutyrate) depolymerase [Chitinophagaceae bacterium]
MVTLILLSNSTIAQPKLDSLLIEGRYRSFYFYSPSKKIKKHTVIFVMHGSGGNGTNMLKPAQALQAAADSLGYFLVYPNGYKNYWNECRRYATSVANKENIPEEIFFEGMLTYFHAKFRTNKKSFFAIGLSGGGHMAYKLAMTMPEKCMGITAVVASLPDSTAIDCIAARKAKAVLIANGTKDGLNKYEGGEIIIDNKNWGVMRSTENTFSYWATLAGYTGSPVKEELNDPYPDNGQTITKFSFSDANKPPVILMRVNGGEHAFPKDVDIFMEAASFFAVEKQRGQIK